MNILVELIINGWLINFFIIFWYRNTGIDGCAIIYSKGEEQVRFSLWPCFWAWPLGGYPGHFYARCLCSSWIINRFSVGCLVSDDKYYLGLKNDSLKFYVFCILIALQLDVLHYLLYSIFLKLCKRVKLPTFGVAKMNFR